MNKLLYRIIGWDAFENHESRKLKSLSWVAMPNHHDGAGYRSLVERPNGAALYGAWCVLVQIASRCPPPRGRIMSPGGPLGANELALKTGIPAATFDELFKIACDPSVGWLESISGDSPGIARNFPELPDTTPIHSTVQKGTVQKGRVRSDPVPEKTNIKTTGAGGDGYMEKPEAAPDRNKRLRRASTPGTTKVASCAAEATGATPERPTIDSVISSRPFVQVFILKIAEAFRWTSVTAMGQRKSLSAIGRRLLKEPDRDDLAADFIAWARDKADDPALEKPVAAWQKEVTRTLAVRDAKRKH